MAGASFSRYLGYDVLSGTTQAVGAASAQITVPDQARLALMTVTTDTRFLVGDNPTATAADPTPIVLSGSTIPINVRKGLKIAVIQNSAGGNAYIIWCA